MYVCIAISLIVPSITSCIRILFPVSHRPLSDARCITNPVLYLAPCYDTICLAHRLLLSGASWSSSCSVPPNLAILAVRSQLRHSLLLKFLLEVYESERLFVLTAARAVPVCRNLNTLTTLPGCEAFALSSCDRFEAIWHKLLNLELSASQTSDSLRLSGATDKDLCSPINLGRLPKSGSAPQQASQELSDHVVFC